MPIIIITTICLHVWFTSIRWNKPRHHERQELLPRLLPVLFPSRGIGCSNSMQADPSKCHRFPHPDWSTQRHQSRTSGYINTYCLIISDIWWTRFVSKGSACWTQLQLELWTGTRTNVERCDDWKHRQLQMRWYNEQRHGWETFHNYCQRYSTTTKMRFRNFYLFDWLDHIIRNWVGESWRS